MTGTAARETAVWGPVLASLSLTSLHHAVVLAAGEPSSQILERRGNARALSQVNLGRLALVLVHHAAALWP